eukprot:2916549-Alexandrium_andersonii.AAC.1
MQLRAQLEDWLADALDEVDASAAQKAVGRKRQARDPSPKPDDVATLADRPEGRRKSVITIADRLIAKRHGLCCTICQKEDSSADPVTPANQ